MRLKILDEAGQDLVQGYRFYELQEKGLGQYFLDSLFSDLESLKVTAGIHPLLFGEYHRLLASRFPFAIYYKLDHDVVLVHAILDCRRKPAWTRKRLDRT